MWWFDSDTSSSLESPATLDGFCSKLDVFKAWLRIALSREYLASCKFEENAGVSDDNEGSVHSSESSSMTHSTIKSRMRVARKGSIIMPFRADTAECLFLSYVTLSLSTRF